MRQSPAPASTVSRLKLPRLVRMAGESGIIPRRCAAATPFRFAPLRSPSQPRWSLWGSRHAGEAQTRTAPQATAWSDYRRAPPGYASRLPACAVRLMRQSPAPASTVSRLKLPRLVRMAGESGIIPRRCAAATPFRFAPLRSPSQPRWSLWGSRHAGEAQTRTAPQATAWSDYRRAPPGYAPRLAAQGGKTNGAKPGSGFYGFPAAAATFSKDIRGKQCHSAPLFKPRYRPQGTRTRAKPIHGQHPKQQTGPTTV